MVLDENKCMIHGFTFHRETEEIENQRTMFIRCVVVKYLSILCRYSNTRLFTKNPEEHQVINRDEVDLEGLFSIFYKV